jgi:hypothetical protein
MAKKARILVALHLEGNLYQPDQVVEFDDKLAKVLEKDGHVDTNAAAVADSVERLGAKLLRHAPTGAEVQRIADATEK